MKSLFLKFWILVTVIIFVVPQIVFAQSFETLQPLYCNYEYPEDVIPQYSYEYLGSKRKMSFSPGELAKITVHIKNTGTVPMFSDESGCKFRPITRLGTARESDRESVFHTLLFEEDSGWQSPNRIKLDQKRLDPGQKGSFTFWGRIPHEEGIYREYFDVVIEGKEWLGTDFVINLDVGQYIIDNREYLDYVDYSRKVTEEDLMAEKSIEVDISSQMMYLKVGDIVIRAFPVSTGTWRTPTPYGHTQIYYKQEVRVAAKWPHYIMPKWLNFRHGGFGIHALPSIAFDNGYYWREALSHIGSRRSHGCIRLLPADAEFAYDFTDVGIAVWVHE